MIDAGRGESRRNIMPRILNLDALAAFCRDNSLTNFRPREYKESTRAELIREVSFPAEPAVIGVFGSAFESQGKVADTSMAEGLARDIAGQLGEYRGNIVLVTGACPDNSLPTVVAAELKKIAPEVPVVGISPWVDYTEAISENPDGYAGLRISHDMIIYTDFGDFLMRDGSNDNLVDGAISIRGSCGTNHELAGLYEAGKVVGLLAGSEGVSDAQGRVVGAFKEDGKNHYVVFAESDPRELVRKVAGQIFVDNYLKAHRESSSIDVYTKQTDSGNVVPIVNVRRFRMRGGEYSWKTANDRRYPFVGYDNRQDLSHAGKLLLGVERSCAREYIQDLLHQEMETLSICRPGEVGVLLFPRRKAFATAHEAVPEALEIIAGEERDRVFYHQQLKN